MARCSTIGPSDSAGKKIKPPMIRMTLTNSTMNVPPLVGNVPLDGGTTFLATSEPATAIIGTMNRKRPNSMDRPLVRL